MPTQRPFFANFFSAFRARSSPTFQAKSSTTTGAISPSILSASAHVSTTIATATSASTPRNITTKTASDANTQGNNTATIGQPIKTGSTSPFGATALTSGSPGTTFYRRPPSPSPHGHNLAMSPPGHTNAMVRGRQRRDSGSSNSSGGFMDAMGSEKWYVGGRTATGEERFYQLSLVSGSDGRRPQRPSCIASSRCLYSIVYGQIPAPYILEAIRKRRFSINANDCSRIPATTHFECRPRLVQYTNCKNIESLHVRRYASALAASSIITERPHSEVEEHEKLYTGDFTESFPTVAGVESLTSKAPIRRVELLRIPGFLRKLAARLSSHGSVATFESFKLWDDVLPVLAAGLGLQHIIIDASSAYYNYAAHGSTPNLRNERGAQRNTAHILINLSGRPLGVDEVDDSLIDALHDHIFVRNIEHWLHDFRENVDNPSYPAWKVLMLVCRNSPTAMPRLEVIPAHTRHMANPDATMSSVQSHQVRLINEQYNILIVHCFDKNMPFSETVLNTALLTYLEAIHNILPSDEDYPFRFVAGMWEPAQFLGRALSALGWGDVRFEEQCSNDFLPSVPTSDLWQLKVSTPRHGQFDSPTIWHGKKCTRLLAILHACSVVKGHLQAAHQSGRLASEDYQVFAQYWGEEAPEVKQIEVGASDTSSPPVYKISINDTVVSDMLEALRALVQAGFQSTYDWISSEAAGLRLSHTKSKTVQKDENLDQILYRAYSKRGARPNTDELDLPVRDQRVCSGIKEAIESSAVTIITAATGSGKTTQVPQIILDEYIAARNGSVCSIVCTQPRRVSAISVATRVASERRQPLGREIGYKVRFDSRPTRSDCGITYMTSGYLLRLLEVDPLGILGRHSHIILDEVHARDVDTDLILANLKNYLGKRTVVDAANMPKIILMSASIDAKFFRNYFEELGVGIKVTAIDVPGKMYDVEHKNLDHILVELQEDYPHQFAQLLAIPDVGRYVNEQISVDLKDERSADGDNQDLGVKTDQVKSMIQDHFVPISLIHLMIVRLLSTTDSGDVLVFMPGLGEIDALETILRVDALSASKISDPERYRIFKLHSALYQTNYDVFKEIPVGCRRIVFATNIAETSITLPSVKFVIDTGLSRQSTFDQITQSGTFGLQWISKAEVMQRKGRAGRTQAGVYYGLYSQAQHDGMSDAPTPEILKMSLDHLVLRCSSSPTSHVRAHCWPKIPGIEDVRAGHVILTTPSPPQISSVAAAGHQLHHIHALTAVGTPTPMGIVLSHFPMNPTAAKAVLLGMIFRCLDATLISGALREDSPLMYDPSGIGGTAERRRKLAKGTDDDKLADSLAFFSYDRARRRNDRFAAEKLKDELSIRHDAYCEYAQVAEQTFDTIRPMMGLPKGDTLFYQNNDLPWPLFPATPPALNTNSTNADLVKALAFSTSGTRFACWNHKNWRAQLHPRVLPHPKSVNHNGSRRTILAQRLRRENGDLLSYGTMRTIPKDKYPWLHDTSAITPLMAILFAESVSFLEAECVFLINGWVRYELSPTNPGQNVGRVAKIIWEYRKALDRFVAHAMQMISLDPSRIHKVHTRELSVNNFNVFFQPQDNAIRKTIVDSVIKVLGADSRARKHRAVIRALENEGIEAVVAEDIQRRGDLEGLIEFILERNRGPGAKDTAKTEELKAWKGKSISDILKPGSSRAVERPTYTTHAGKPSDRLRVGL